MADLYRVTVIVGEQESPFPPSSPWPLIYQLDVPDPKDEADLKTRVARERFEELCEMYQHAYDSDPEATVARLDEIRNGLEIHVVLAGEVHVIADHRC